MSNSLTVNRLSERVSIQQPVYTSDGIGGQTLTWSELACVYAEVKPISNFTTARNLADTIQATAGYQVTMRLRDDVNASMQIVWKTHTLKISALHADGDLLEILTYEESV